MFNSIAFDVVIGLIFIYLLYSLLISIISEMIATWLGLRARILRLAVERMLNDGLSEKIDESKWVPMRGFLRRFFLVQPEEFNYTLAGRFYNHPSIKYLAIGQTDIALSFMNGKPAYFSAEIFANTLIYLFRDKGIGSTDWQRVAFSLEFNTLAVQPETLKLLRHLELNAGEDIDLFKLNLKVWFEETMDRANGWYKRKLQFLLFWLGFILAFSFNVDTITIATTLSRDKGARDQMVLMAIQGADANSPISKAIAQSNDPQIYKDSLLAQSYKLVKGNVDQANQVLGLGWKSVKVENFHLLNFYGKQKQLTLYPQLNPFRKEFWGLIITALALSLGAPFWFDLLKRLVSLRGSGVRPEDEKDKLNKIKNEAVIPSDNEVRPISNVTGHIALSKDLIEEAIRCFGPKIMSIPGVISVMKGFNNLEKYVQINVANELAGNEVRNQFPKLKVGSTSFIPIIVLAGQPVTQQANKGQISNRSGLNSFGSIGCIIEDKETRVRHLLSCWHVLHEDRYYDERRRNEDTIILDHTGNTIGDCWTGGISGSLDFGFARCLKPMDNKWLQNYLKGPTPKYRPVKLEDIENHITIKFYDCVSAPPQIRTGKIYTQGAEVKIDYYDRTRAIKDILVLADQVGKDAKPISIPGNSGAIIFDINNNAIAMIIGGDDKYTYAIKLSNIFSIFEEMKLV